MIKSIEEQFIKLTKELRFCDKCPFVKCITQETNECDVGSWEECSLGVVDDLFEYHTEQDSDYAINRPKECLELLAKAMKKEKK
jgi:hypothetical protein